MDFVDASLVAICKALGLPRIDPPKPKLHAVKMCDAGHELQQTTQQLQVLEV